MGFLIWLKELSDAYTGLIGQCLWSAPRFIDIQFSFSSSHVSYLMSPRRSNRCDWMLDCWTVGLWRSLFIRLSANYTVVVKHLYAAGIFFTVNTFSLRCKYRDLMKYKINQFWIPRKNSDQQWYITLSVPNDREFCGSKVLILAPKVSSK